MQPRSPKYAPRSRPATARPLPRRGAWIALVALALAAPTIAATHVNGGFEAGTLSGWTQTGTDATRGSDSGAASWGEWARDVDPAYAHDGAYGARLRCRESGAPGPQHWCTAGIQQNFTESTGIGIWFKLIEGTSYWAADLVVTVNDGTDSVGWVFDPSLPTASSDRNDFLESEQLPAGAWHWRCLDVPGLFMEKHDRPISTPFTVTLYAYADDAQAEAHVDTIASCNAPGIPQTLQAEAGQETGQVKLTWDTPASDGGFPVTNYRVHRGTTTGGPYAQIAEVGNVLTYTDSGLPDGATRCYWVSAVNEAGEGSKSPSACATTFGPPSGPRNLQAEAGQETGQVKLTWDTPASDGGFPVTNYRVHRSATSGGPYAQIAEVGNVLTYTDDTCALGSVCFYVVSAVNAVGEGPSSNEAFAPGTAPRSSVPINIPPAGASETVPAQSTPPVPPQTVTTPPVTTPPTCPVQPCNNPTTVPSQTVATPGVDPQTVTTPEVPVPETCVPLVVCVGPFTIPPQTVTTPEVPPHTVTTPPVTVPAVCEEAGAICLPPVTLLPSQSMTTPGIDPVPLTPRVTVSASTTGLTGLLTPHLGEVGTIGPVTVEVPTPFGPIPVTLCPETCPAPVAPEGTLQGSVTVTVTVGNDTIVSETVPVEVDA